MQLTNAKSDLDKAKKTAEKMDIQRLQLENDIQSLKETMEMDKRVHAQELK